MKGADHCVDGSVVDYLLAPKKPRPDKVCRYQDTMNKHSQGYQGGKRAGDG
ncbi:hypothetical protein M5G07_11190 [Serratia symbiotica]|nr:hypothetical protein [Serratia symbiotica]